MVFKTFIYTMKPLVSVEVGILDGYSLFNLAIAIKSIRNKFGIDCKLDGYDLFDDYRYKHGNFENIQKLSKEFGVDEFTKLYKMDAFEAYKLYRDNSIDLLHFDISNDGDILEKMINTWHSKIRPGGIILFEGGSKERDEVDWMIRYNKKPINPVLSNNEIINKQYNWFLYQLFPSITLFFKKGEE